MNSTTSSDHETMLRIDEALCFALYAASRAVTSLYRPVLSEMGLTYPQYLVMLALWEHDDVPIKTIAGRLKLDHGTLTPILKRLEAAGHITRTRSPDDERTVRISLTAGGSALRERALSIPPEIAGAMDLDAETFTRLRTALADLTESVGKHTVSSPS